MSDQPKNDLFEYTYSAPTERERKTIEAIRNQYTQKPQKSAFERLVALDEKIKGSATAVALILGVGGCLIFGLGLAMVLEWQLFIPGIIVMALGVVPMLLAYPGYKKVFKMGKNKYGEEILTLSANLLKKDK